MNTAVDSNAMLWIARFEVYMKHFDEDDPHRALGKIFTDFLRSNKNNITARTALQITHYGEHGSFLDPESSRDDDNDEEIKEFLFMFYEEIFILGRIIPFNSFAQERLICLLLDLRNLPPKSVKIWDEDCLIWTREPVSELLLSRLYKYHPIDLLETNDKISKNYIQAVCDHWVNLSAFLARCVEAGLLVEDKYRWEYPCEAIVEGLEKENERKSLELMRACKIMVAANYILLSGRSLAIDCFNDSDKGRAQWRRWAEKLREISKRSDEKTPLIIATKAAWQHMISLHPECFSDSD